MSLPLRAAALLALIVAACGGGDGGDDSDGNGGRADAGVDAAAETDAAATSMCNAPGDCPCFSNHDCPETHACTSLDDTGENVFCLAGPRGTGLVGEPCTGEASCASALCIEDDSGSFCSDICEVSDECPAVLPQCLYIGFGVDKSICAPL